MSDGQPQVQWLSAPMSIADDKLQRCLGDWYEYVLAHRRGELPSVSPDEHATRLKAWQHGDHSQAAAAAAPDAAELVERERAASEQHEQGPVHAVEPGRHSDACGHAARGHGDQHSA